jgi:site-specific recombinase XerD
LAGAVPSAASWPASTLPQPLDRRQVAQLLCSCDRRTRCGRRDFAVLALLLRLGLRAGEVAALELGDLDWRSGDILVRGKGRRVERLPLPVDVGQAVASWLRYGRPRCSSRQVFTTLLAPRQGLSRKGISAIVHRAGQRSGVATTAHRLRHTAACALLRSGASLPEIGQVLRHGSMLSTAIYAKVDHAALSAVARPWPGAR